MLSAIPPNECARARESISAGLDDALTEFEAAGLDGHLRGCGECRAFARQLHALHSVLGAAPLEQPTSRVFVPARRRPFVRIQTVAAAAAIIVVAAGSSFAVGRVVGAHGRSATTALTGAAGSDFLSIQADSTAQHIRAMLPYLAPSDSLRSGRVIAV
jgi:predicted anti-sigma-YlaC factor YlaD